MCIMYSPNQIWLRKPDLGFLFMYYLPNFDQWDSSLCSRHTRNYALYLGCYHRMRYNRRILSNLLYRNWLSSYGTRYIDHQQSLQCIQINKYNYLQILKLIHWLHTYPCYTHLHHNHNRRYTLHLHTGGRKQRCHLHHTLTQPDKLCLIYIQTSTSQDRFIQSYHIH